MFSPYLGVEYIVQSSDLVNAEAEVSHVGKKKFTLAANAIASGKIVAWYQGKSECGPRALGNRSILADPRNSRMKDILNNRVKHRESFRPFAPAVLWEHQTEYFELDVKSPYMLMVANVKPQVRDKIPSVVHIDGTARVQSVDKNLTPLFYHLIEEFMNTTGVPLVINTSFNVQGEPIVETPQDALKCFLTTHIDELYIGDYMLYKKE